MSPQRIHLIGVGGVGMAGLAVLLKNRSFEVSGCDASAAPRLKWLEGKGIKIFDHHCVSHLEGVDKVVATPAVPLSIPERSLAKDVKMRGEVLSRIVSEAKDSIAVCGSHGKTTTCTFIIRMLLELGENVEWAVGGETGDFPLAGGGKGGVLVVEADESDATLALYKTKLLVVTNVDYDHPDKFPTLESYRSCFDTARANAAMVIEGEGLTNEEIAVKVLLSRGHDLIDVERALKKVSSELPDRRFQKLTEGVYADYAHHPAEIRYCLKRAKILASGKVRVLFQPHRYSRTKRFLTEFSEAFDLADEVVLCPVYPAFEEPIEGGTTAYLYQRMRELGRRPLLARSCDEAWEHASNVQEDGDITLVMGAGDIIKIASLVNIKEKCNKRIYLGSGTNTWKSDLSLDVQYVKPDCPAQSLGSTLGIPWMAGIPGTIGGWVVMNAGAFGHSISELVESVKVDGKWISADECKFAYRSSGITGLVEDVKFKPFDRDEKLHEKYLSSRPKFPSGTKGSVFKNPPGDFAGRLLEQAGVKGLRVGGAYVWEKHANVIVAEKDAANSDFLALALIMKDKVVRKFGIELEPEVRGLS